MSVVVLDGFLAPPCGGCADAMVDGQCLSQPRGGLAGVAVVEVGLAESFQGACFLRGRADVTGDGQRGVDREDLHASRAWSSQLSVNCQ
jgi:hypothetical protein